MTIPLVRNIDGFEAVRNAVANILATETVNQVAAANAWNVANPTQPQLDSSEWSFDVMTEMVNASPSFIDDETDFQQIVNVWYDSSNIDRGRSTPTRQWTTTTINVDCIASAITEETDSGQITGDVQAVMNAQRLARICRRILMHPDYRQFALSSVVSTRTMVSRVASSRSVDHPAKHIAGVQLQFEVVHLESYDYESLSASEGALITIYREPDGKVIYQMDIDWT